MSKAERPSEMKQQAGLRLRACRDHLGLSQDALARALGVERTTYNNWENGTRMPDVAAMVRLYQRTGITLEWIFAGSLRELSYDVGESLRQHAARLGAVVGGPVAEWPMAVSQGAGLAAERTPAAVPPFRDRSRTLHEGASALEPPKA